MHEARFFQSTRGKIVAALRHHHSASAVDLAGEFGLSPNAVRQHLVFLERDGLVAERPVKRGRTKPTFEYSLTAEGEALFPQQYDRMLDAVLREVRAEYGDPAVNRIFQRLGERQAAALSRRLTQADTKGKVEALAQTLRGHGVDAEVIVLDEAIELREHNCPFSKTVADHPEVCSAIHAVFDEMVPGEARQVESLATGGTTCRFDIRADRTRKEVATK